MKKIFLALLALAAAVAPSCTKQDTDTPFSTTAIFTLDGFDTGLFPTKGMAEVIAATLPESLELSVQNTATGTTYTTTTGEPINIPVGTYRVTACNNPTSVKEITGSALFLSHVPRVRVDAEVEVVAGVGSYPLTAAYESVALAILTSETSGWAGTNSSKQGFEVEAITSGIYKWTFLTGDIAARKFVTTLTPAGGGATRSFTIVGNAELLANYSDALLVVPGHWYVLHPSDAATQSGGFSVSFPDWTAGN